MLSPHELSVRLAVAGDVGDLVDLMEELYAEASYALDRQWARSSLLALIARPALRRRGIGRALLDELFRECRARGCRAAHVEVGPSNTPALGLYAKFGLLPHQESRQLLAGGLLARA